MYEGWGKTSEVIYHGFPADTTAMHYSPLKLQEAVLNSGWFEVKEDNVETIEDIDADYVFDCRGKPQSLDDCKELVSPVNSAILAKPLKDMSNTKWTRAVATPDGWCFMIPTIPKSPSYPYSIGYIYNKDITSQEEATSHFQELFDVELTQHLNFKSYVTNNPVIDNRIISNGNRLFFLEPLESTAVAAYMEWMRYTFEVIIKKNWEWEYAIECIQKHLHRLETFILWHYQFGSQYDTLFWKYAQTLNIQDTEFDRFVTAAKNERWSDLSDLSNDSKETYGQWEFWNFKIWYEGVT